MRAAANDDRESRPLTVSDQDLSAYVAGTLPADRRTEVEGFLACNPDLAARVMTELHRQGRGGGAPPKSRMPWRRATAGAAAAVVAAIAGWQVAGMVASGGWREDDGDPAPAYLEEAKESRDAAQVRAIMVSQTDTPTMDIGEIQKILKLHPPQLPAGWRLIDAQVYPSDNGPALNVVLETPGGRRLNLFAVSANTAAGAAPVLVRRGREAAAYWEVGRSAFVLMGAATAEQLLQEARALAQAS